MPCDTPDTIKGRAPVRVRDPGMVQVRRKYLEALEAVADAAGSVPVPAPSKSYPLYLSDVEMLVEALDRLAAVKEKGR